MVEHGTTSTPPPAGPGHVRPLANTRVLSLAAVVGACIGFVLIGALQALYGPAVPAFQDRFSVPLAAAGLALSLHFTGALVGVLTYHLLRRRYTDRVLLGASYALMALGCAVFALAPGWATALASAAAIGLGFGGIDYGLNQLFAAAFERRSAAMLNLLNAHFGVGAIAGPAMLGWIGPDRYTWVFAAGAVLSATLLLSLRGVGKPRQANVNASTPGTAGRRAATLVSLFVVLYVLHVAVETGVGGWEPTHLLALGYSTTGAALATSTYWLALTLGRFFVIPLTLRVSGPYIVIGSCLGMAACLALAGIPLLTPYAYIGVGLFIAPIFPTALPWLNRAVPAVTSAGAYVIAASMIGGVAFPPLLGAAIDVSGARALPILLLLLALLCLATSLTLQRRTRHASNGEA